MVTPQQETTNMREVAEMNAGTNRVGYFDRHFASYYSGPIKIDHCHISAPHVYAVVLEKLQIQPG